MRPTGLFLTFLLLGLGIPSLYVVLKNSESGLGSKGVLRIVICHFFPMFSVSAKRPTERQDILPSAHKACE